MERDEALLRKVGDVIASEPWRYDQIAVLSECGSVGCIAGLSAVLAFPDKSGAALLELYPITLMAERALGLTSDEAVRLFKWNWEPAGDPSVPLHERVRDALYALAEGASVEEVTA